MFFTWLLSTLVFGGVVWARWWLVSGRKQSNKKIGTPGPRKRTGVKPKVKSTPRLTTLPTNGILVVGKAGAGLESGTGTFSNYSTNAGVLGEAETSSLMSRLFRKSPTPLVLVNSIRYLGSKTADVDHALIAGKTVFLIDSKKYRKGIYTPVSSNTVQVTLQNRQFLRKIHMDDALSNFRASMPYAKFPLAYVMIHTDGRVNSARYGNVFFGTPEACLRDMKQYFPELGTQLDGRVVSTIDSLRKS